MVDKTREGKGSEIDIRELQDVNDRVETGPIQFGGDWPGTFIRGDRSIYYASCLENHLAGNSNMFQVAALRGLVALLKRSDLRLRAAASDAR